MEARNRAWGVYSSRIASARLYKGHQAHHYQADCVEAIRSVFHREWTAIASSHPATLLLAHREYQALSQTERNEEKGISSRRSCSRTQQRLADKTAKCRCAIGHQACPTYAFRKGQVSKQSEHFNKRGFWDQEESLNKAQEISTEDYGSLSSRVGAHAGQTMALTLLLEEVRHLAASDGLRYPRKLRDEGAWEPRVALYSHQIGPEIKSTSQELNRSQETRSQSHYARTCWSGHCSQHH